jgi:Flp pilus assembly protein TadB
MFHLTAAAQNNLVLALMALIALVLVLVLVMYVRQANRTTRLSRQADALELAVAAATADDTEE